MRTINELCDILRETSYAIHVYHGHGHLEKVYEYALAHRLRKLGLDVSQQHLLRVYDEDGTLIGDYQADLLIENCLIVEIKAARALADEHVAQLLGYRSTHAKPVTVDPLPERGQSHPRRGPPGPRDGLADAGPASRLVPDHAPEYYSAPKGHLRGRRVAGRGNL